MRWIWIDKFEHFEPGVSAVAIKNVSQAEDHLHDHFPGFPVMPASLMIEGMAQTAGVICMLTLGPQAQDSSVFFLREGVPVLEVELHLLAMSAANVFGFVTFHMKYVFEESRRL